GDAPILQAFASAQTLRAVGVLDGILFVGRTHMAEDDTPLSEAWFDVGEFGNIDSLGIDGSGVTAVDILGVTGVYDSTYLALPTGPCDSSVGPDYTCYCAAATPRPKPTSNCSSDHLQCTMSVMKNTWTTLRGGASDSATMLVGGTGGGVCSPSNLTGVVPW